MTSALKLLLAVFLTFGAVRATTISISNSGVEAVFSASLPQFGSLLSLTRQDHQLLAQSTTSLWSASFLTSLGDTRSIDGTNSTVAVSAERHSASSVTLHWTQIALGVSNVTVNASLSVNITQAGLCELLLSLSEPTGGAPGAVALWDYSISVDQVAVNQTSSLLENSGFGVARSCEAHSSVEGIGCQGWTGNYPQSTFQFMGVWHNTPGTPAFYFGAHDAGASSKTFAATVNNSANTVGFSVQTVAADAGRVQGLQNSFPVIFGPVAGSWWDLSQVYRQWVLLNADWTKKGTLAHRSDVPDWLFNVTTWINSHWQGNDIFNISGGDPEVVKQRVLAIADRFGPLISGNKGDGPELALHWYEWDTLGYKEGSNYTKCENEVTCGFDTHYPEYFPVRSGFQEALGAMQARGIRVAPYINGRIFDQATETWENDDASRFAAKQLSKRRVIPPSGPDASNLALYDEQYGSKAVFAVMCPHTRYWQSTISHVVDRLANVYHTDGVYIDQIAAAGPRPCWDPSHNHSLGGGNHWVTGYRAMLNSVRQVAGNNKVVLTESNAEPFMDGVNVFLTLVGFSRSNILPVFPAVYGGYYFAAGAEFFVTDFTPDPDVFASKIAQQFVFGAQMGWFSLGGRSNQSPFMGIYDPLMDPAHDMEIEYLRRLSQARFRVKNWFNHGRSMRDLPLYVNDTLSNDGSTLSCTWLSSDETSLLVIITTVRRYSPAFSLKFDISMAEYGFNIEQGSRFNLSRLEIPHGETNEGRYDGNSVHFSGVLAAREIILLKIQRT